MRVVKVKAPQGKGQDVANVALGVGISAVAVHQAMVYGPNQHQELKDVIDVDTSTPAAKTFIETLMAAPFFDPESYTISVRAPRAIVAQESPAKLTWPIVLPTIDILQDLWQFTHVTMSLVVRVLIAAMFLAYGMIKANFLLMMAGLLFLPFLPILLAIGFGLRTREWRLAKQGVIAFIVSTVLIVTGGVIVALLTKLPMQFQQFSPLPVSFLISLGVGIAAAVANADDVGRREFVGLAASAQVALIPAWFGIALVHGFAATTPASSPTQRGLSFGINIATIIVMAIVTYVLLGMRSKAAHLASRSTVHSDEQHRPPA